MQFFLTILSGMANSIDPDQTAPSGAVWSGPALFVAIIDPDQTAPSGAFWSGSALFANAILSETLMYEISGHES